MPKKEKEQRAQCYESGIENFRCVKKLLEKLSKMPSEEEIINNLVERVYRDWVCSDIIINSSFDPESESVYICLRDNYDLLKNLEFNQEIICMIDLQFLCEHNLAITLKYFLLYFLININDIERCQVFWNLLCFFRFDGNFERVAELVNKKIIKEVFEIAYNFELIYYQLSEVETDLLLDCVIQISKDSFKN